MRLSHPVVNIIRDLVPVVTVVLMARDNLLPRSSRDVIRELAVAVRSGDIAGFLDASSTLLTADDRKVVRVVIDGYERLCSDLARDDRRADLFYFHSRTAALMKHAAGESAVGELRRLLRTSKEWRTRVLILDGALFNRRLDLEEVALEALEDSSPIVVRRALRYLSRADKVSVADRIIKRYTEVTEKPPRGDKQEWERTCLAFDGALQQMLHVDLSAPIDWKNYVNANRDRKDLFDPARRRQQSAVTQLTLFGAAVTGKNIAFVLDVSGSMLTTDPLPPGEIPEDLGRTIVIDPRNPVAPRIPPDQRRRINRAKRELARVVTALPPDVRFNIIAYSTDVRSWSRSLTVASSEAKKAAKAYIEGLEAEGITVTDMALEDAFTDLRVDTIYVLTDGAPTHVGSTGPGKPRDSDELIRAIHKRVRELNFLRDVRIFTLGFKGAEEDFLRELARDNGGRYVRIR